MKSKTPIFILILLVLSFWLGTKRSSPVPEQKITETKETAVDFSITLNRDNKIVSKLPVNEVVLISSVVDKFEKYIYLKNPISAFEMITPPVSADEISWNSHFLGKDIPINGKPSDRFSNIVNYYRIVGYDIKKIEDDGGLIKVNVNELRVISKCDSKNGCEGVTSTQQLIFEMIKENSDYRISKYHHEPQSSGANIKYDGFVAY